MEDTVKLKIVDEITEENRSEFFDDAFEDINTFDEELSTLKFDTIEVNLKITRSPNGLKVESMFGMDGDKSYSTHELRVKEK